MSQKPRSVQRIRLLTQVSTVGTSLLGDVTSLALEAKQQVSLFKAGEVSLEEACFWLKSLVGAFFASADGIAFTIREVLRTNIDSLGVEFSRRVQRDLDTTKHLPLERAVPVALRSLAAVFTAPSAIDTGTEDFRGFKVLTDCRERFTHPKNHLDVCPAEMFPTINASIEWFLFAWRSTLFECLKAEGLNPTFDVSSDRRFMFSDRDLAPFSAVRDKSEAERISGFASDLHEVIFPLQDDTGRAKDALSQRNTITSVPASCAARNLVRTLFAEIEGTVLIAAALLHKYRAAPAPSPALLIGAHEAVRTAVVETVEEFSREFGVGRRVIPSGESWKAFTAMREVRNRISHPKVPSDLEVGGAERDAMLKLTVWWRDQAEACLEFTPSSVPQ